MVNGDVFPQLVADLHDLFTIPLTKIFNVIKVSYVWPESWRIETVTVISKNKTPHGFEDCPNLSCTPLFSKVIESFLLDQINGEVKVDLTQFSGVKKCGTEHLLIEAWDGILRDLEDNRGSMNNYHRLQ